jgi:hypothetical protein
MIARLRAFGSFWYDFVVGDDWRVAVGVALSLAVTYGLTRVSSISVWWVLPAAVAVLLPLSLVRAVRAGRR